MGHILPAVVVAGGAGVAGVLHEPCHPEFPISPIARCRLSIKNTGGAFLNFLFIASLAILFPNKKGH